MMQRQLQLQQPCLGGRMPTLQEVQLSVLQNSAATLIQRHLKGLLVRRHVRHNHEAYLFFRRVQRTVQVRDLVVSVKNAFIHIKNTKQRELKKYILHSVTRIQSLVRGFLARKVKVPTRRAIKSKVRKLGALALGWKIRRIFKLKEVQFLVQQV